MPSATERERGTQTVTERESDKDTQREIKSTKIDTEVILIRTSTTETNVY